MAKTASVNIRVPEELKENLSAIAKKKDTSLNDVASTVLADFVESYELEKVKDKKIPTAEEARKIRERKHVELVEEALETAKVYINGMLDDGYSYTTLSNDEIISQFVKAEVVVTLKELGYSVYQIVHGFSLPELTVALENGDIIIGLEDEDIQTFIDNDKSDIPF